MQRPQTLPKIFFVSLLAVTGFTSLSRAASPPGAYCATIPTGCQLLNVEVYPMTSSGTSAAAGGGGSGWGAAIESIMSVPKVLVIKKYCNNGAFGISHMQIEGTQVFATVSDNTGTVTKGTHQAGAAYVPGAFSCP